MKLADIQLDTAYANRDGQPLVVVSLEKYYASKARFHSTTIRPKQSYDRSFGLVAVTRGFSGMNITMDELRTEAARLREDMPKNESLGSPMVVSVVPLSRIVRTWEAQAEEDERQRRSIAAQREDAERVAAERTALLARIRNLLPEGIVAFGSPKRDIVEMRLTDLLSILEGAAK